MHAMFIENIIMFIPFGVLLPIVFKQVRSGWKCVLIGFLCSCGIEITQHITQRGYLQLDVYRMGDMEDRMQVPQNMSE